MTEGCSSTCTFLPKQKGTMLAIEGNPQVRQTKGKKDRRGVDRPLQGARGSFNPVLVAEGGKTGVKKPISLIKPNGQIHTAGRSGKFAFSHQPG